MASKQAVFGIVDSITRAERVVRELQQMGFSTEDVSVLFPDQDGVRDLVHEKKSKAPEGTVAGVGAGGALGGALGLLAGLGALAFPGVGAFIVAGPILAMLSGAAAGATVGGVAGALIGAGVPEIEAKQYEGKLREGNILISVHTETAEQETQAKRALKDAGAEHIASSGEARVPDRGQDVSAYGHL